VNNRSFNCDDTSDAQWKAFKVLVVEDESMTRLNIARTLVKLHLEILDVNSGEEALELIRSHQVDLVLLDILLPGMNGFEVCRMIRAAGITTAIIMLTQLDAKADIIRGLKVGADDYIVKPFDPEELLARIEAVLRRVKENNAASFAIKFQDLTLDFHSQKCFRGGEDLSLTPKEIALLTALCCNPGQVMSRSRLVREVWSEQHHMSDNSLDVYIGRLRQKVERFPAEPSVIKTVRGRGYVFGSEKPSTPNFFNELREEIASREDSVFDWANDHPATEVSAETELNTPPSVVLGG
jgi:two-component system response regulator MprA